MEDTQYRKIFGENLRLLRESFGQTREAFAARLDSSVHTLQSYEAGTRSPNFRRFLQICNVLTVSPNNLLTGLYPWPTEIDHLRELARITEGLDETVAQTIRGVQDIFIESALDTPPKLTGAGFGPRLHLLRTDVGMDVTALAEMCMVARPTIQGYESGQYDPSIPVILRLCEALGVSPDYLLAPELERPSCPDARLADLRPRQIKALLDVTQYLANNF